MWNGILENVKNGVSNFVTGYKKYVYVGDPSFM
jgi:hypothetical protein